MTNQKKCFQENKESFTLVQILTHFSGFKILVAIWHSGYKNGLIKKAAAAWLFGPTRP